MRRADQAHTGANLSHQRWMLSCMCQLIEPVRPATAMGELPRAVYERVVRELEACGQLKRATVSRINAVLHTVEPPPEWLAKQLAQEHLGQSQLRRLIENEILASPHIYGGTVAFAPEKPGGANGLNAPYFYRKNGRLEYVNLADASYDY